MSNTRFSILMANYNRASYLSEAIESILKQGFSDWELILIDDASTDNSVEIIQSFATKDSRIKYFQNDVNKGVGYTKHALIEKAIGEICAFVDSDDTIAENALEILYQAHQNRTESIIYSQHIVCDANLTPLRTGSSRKIPKGENHLTCFGISHMASFKLKDYHRTEKLDTSLTQAIDQDLYYKLEEMSGCYFIPQTLYYYRHNDESISLHQHKKKATQQKLKAMQKAVERRKKSNIKYPSSLLIGYWKYKELDEKLKHPLISSINYYLYAIKIKFKQWLLK